MKSSSPLRNQAWKKDQALINKREKIRLNRIQVKERAELENRKKEKEMAEKFKMNEKKRLKAMKERHEKEKKKELEIYQRDQKHYSELLNCMFISNIFLYYFLEIYNDSFY